MSDFLLAFKHTPGSQLVKGRNPRKLETPQHGQSAPCAQWCQLQVLTPYVAPPPMTPSSDCPILSLTRSNVASCSFACGYCNGKQGHFESTATPSLKHYSLLMVTLVVVTFSSLFGGSSVTLAELCCSLLAQCKPVVAVWRSVIFSTLFPMQCSDSLCQCLWREMYDSYDLHMGSFPELICSIMLKVILSTHTHTEAQSGGLNKNFPPSTSYEHDFSNLYDLTSSVKIRNHYESFLRFAPKGPNPDIGLLRLLFLGNYVLCVGPFS